VTACDSTDAARNNARRRQSEGSYDKSNKRNKPTESDKKTLSMCGIEMTRGELRAQKGIRFVGVKLSDQAKIRRVLRDSFTQAELSMMGGEEGVTVKVGKTPKGKGGAYYRKQKGQPIPEILLDRELTEDTVTHEFVHHARAKDKSRIGYAKTPYRVLDNGMMDNSYYIGNKADIHNIEEAATVAEAAARTRGPAKRPSGYYDEVKGTSKKAAYESDRKRMTGHPRSADIGDTKGVQGKATINRLNREFPKTHIATKKVRGRTALESYDILNKNR
jgi:hypothetical protein